VQAIRAHGGRCWQLCNASIDAAAVLIWGFFGSGQAPCLEHVVMFWAGGRRLMARAVFECSCVLVVGECIEKAMRITVLLGWML
jgi:hypothetical protein